MGQTEVKQGLHLASASRVNEFDRVHQAKEALRKRRMDVYRALQHRVRRAGQHQRAENLHQFAACPDLIAIASNFKSSPSLGLS